MRKATAVKLLRNVSYRPEWLFKTADDFDSLQRLIYGMVTRDDSELCVVYQFKGRDSSHEYAPNYERETEFIPNRTIRIDDIPEKDSDLFYRRVFEGLVSVEIHEMREFFRIINENYRAPFHPHRVDGHQAFEAVRVDQIDPSARV